MAELVDRRRVRIVRHGDPGQRPVIYWTYRDQRAPDNWALLYAQEVALKNKQPLAMVLCLPRTYLGATIRQFGFMLDGLEETDRELRKYGIPLILLTGMANEVLPQFIEKHNVGLLVTDQIPLRIHRQVINRIADDTAIPIHQVDAHNIVPVWVASDHQEFSAATFRPKLHRLLPEFLTSFPRLKRHPYAWPNPPVPDWEKARKSLRVDMAVPEVDWLKPGLIGAGRVLKEFFTHRLPIYGELNRNPEFNAQSDLSPYLHYGQVSAQRIALTAQTYDRWITSQEAFLEQIVVRRELADNFCWYNTAYDSFDGFPDWAKSTLNDHRRDARPHLYNREQFEEAATHDELWNAAQLELVIKGKMHGYMRMYWAKKILEWSRSPEEALADAIYLNDRYSIDGRDPNGYTGIAWSIGGVHDRAFTERDIFGKIRYMSFAGCKRKFDIDAYMAYVVQMQADLKE